MIKLSNKLKKLYMLVLLLLLTGCSGYKDIDKKSIVISVGIDRLKNTIELSTETAKLASESGKAQEEAKITSVYTNRSYGKTFEKARDDLNSQQPYTTFLGATRVVVFGENYAKEGIESYMNRINKIYDYRKTVLSAVSHGSSSQLLQTSLPNDISVGFFIEHNIDYLTNEGQALYTNIGKILSSISMEEVGFLLPYIGKEKDCIKYLGLAVMKDSKLIDVIPRDHTSGLLYILSKKATISEILTHPKDAKNKLSFRTTIDKRKISTKQNKEKISIDIHLDLSAELIYQYYVNPISKKDLQQLENALSLKIQKDIKSIIHKSQKEYKCDIFQFARYFRGDHPNIYEKIKWSDIYPQVDINVFVTTKIINKNLFDPNGQDS